MNSQVQSFSAGGVQIFKGGAGGSNPVGGHLRLDSHAKFESYVRHHTAWQQDAGLTMAFARQLEHVFAKVYEAEYFELKAMELFPVTTEVDPGALSYTYRMSQRIGQAGIISGGNATDLPNISVSAEEWQQPIITLGDSYTFNVIEQASAAMGNIPIEAMTARAAREAIELIQEQIFALGSTNAGVAGVCNVPGLNMTAQTSSGTWVSQILADISTAPLSSTLAKALAQDILSAKAKIYNQSGGRHKATNVALPHNLYSALDFVPQSTLYTSKTLLTWLEELTGLEFNDWTILLDAGAINGSPLNVATVSGGNPQHKTRVLVYEKNPEVMQLVMAQPFTQLAPQISGLAYQVPCYSRIGGAMSIRPLGITAIDGLISIESVSADMDGFYAGNAVCAAVSDVTSASARFSFNGGNV